MALSGSNTGSKVSGFSLRIDWSATQNIASNTSTITATAYLVIDSGWALDINPRTGVITIDGTNYTISYHLGYKGGGTHYLGTASKTITHNANGTRSFAISGSARIEASISGYGWLDTLSRESVTYTLDTIPRASSFTLSGATQTNASINVTISRASTAFTHRVRWRVGSGSWIDIASAATTTASFTVQPGNMPNLKSATITVGVQTYNGTTAIGSEATATRTITIPNTTISISGTASTGSAQTVNIANSGGSLTFTRSWSLGSATGGNVASWTPPHSALPSATSGTLTCTVVTKNGTATINTTSATRTIYVPDNILPTFGSITHTEYVAYVANLVGAYVRGHTRLTLGVTNPSAGSGSSVKAISVSVAGHTVGNGGTTPVINQSGTLTIYATVRDNRDRTVTKTTTITVLAYENPIVTGVSFTRSNSDGTPNTTGDYLTVKATIRVRRLIVNNTEKNKINYQAEWQQLSIAGTGWNRVTNLANQSGSINGNYREDVYTHTYGGFGVDYPYNVRVRGGDIFSWSGYIAGGIPTGVVLQHWGESTTAFGKMIDDVDYNVLVGTKGLKVDGPVDFNNVDFTMPNGRRAVYLSHNNDLNNVVEEWILGQNGSNYPGFDFWYVNTIMYDSVAQRKQIAYGYRNNNVFTRYLYNGTWSAWVQTNVITDSGSNPNGRYIRFSDGTQICLFTVVVNMNTVLFQYYPYPASFVSGQPVSLSASFSRTKITGVDDILWDRVNNVSLYHSSHTEGAVLYRGDVHATTFYAYIQAIGRWK